MLFQKRVVHTTFDIYVFIIHPCYVLNHRPVSLDCPFLIAFSVFSYVYLVCILLDLRNTFPSLEKAVLAFYIFYQ